MANFREGRNQRSDDVVIRDQAYGSEATIEIYAQSIEIKTAWSKYFYRIFVANDLVWCEYNGAYRGLLEQVLLPTIYS